jgi:hypothetical protein
MYALEGLVSSMHYMYLKILSSFKNATNLASDWMRTRRSNPHKVEINTLIKSTSVIDLRPLIVEYVLGMVKNTISPFSFGLSIK